ncbi:hypothetical protein AcW1_007324 [Taiwanofungus camphoratus]|nr:hypothetical protein AcW2_007605 [Antrodia cinnamomea]KAI0927427.1 hypothetical protein AcV5_007970 [Antrodia cinnamomea]KAI0952991.1 hypothetical protein AcW1_007324 [Antrodia cinnamomea]
MDFCQNFRPYIAAWLELPFSELRNNSDSVRVPEWCRPYTYEQAQVTPIPLPLNNNRGHGETLLFKSYLGPVTDWGRVTSLELEGHPCASAGFWARTLSDNGLQPSNVVGSWWTGSKYEDTLDILGVSAAGYVPQLFSVVCGSEDVVWGLLRRSGVKGLVFDNSFSSVITSSPVPTYPSLLLTDIQGFTGAGDVMSHLPAVLAGNAVIIVHSSGTTSGNPKLISTTHSLLMSFMDNKYPSRLKQRSFEGQDVINSLGSLAHVGSLQAVICTASWRVCGPAFPYTPFLLMHIRNAQGNPEVLKALKSLQQILHTGVALNCEDEEWAYKNGLSLTVSHVSVLYLNSAEHS